MILIGLYVVFFLFADNYITTRGLTTTTVTVTVGKPLIIFDFNGVLLHAIHKSSLQKRSMKSPGIYPDIETSTKIYFLRPGFIEFFEKCFSTFEVGIWTSAQKKMWMSFCHYYSEKQG